MTTKEFIYPLTGIKIVILEKTLENLSKHELETLERIEYNVIKGLSELYEACELN